MGIKFHGVETKPEFPAYMSASSTFRRAIRCSNHFRFLKGERQGVMPQDVHPGAARAAFPRLPKDGIPKSVYPRTWTGFFFHDLGQTYKKAVKAFYDAGLPVPAVSTTTVVGLSVLTRTR